MDIKEAMHVMLLNILGGNWYMNIGATSHMISK